MFTCKPQIQRLRIVHRGEVSSLPNGTILSWPDTDGVLTFLAFLRRDDETGQTWLDMNSTLLGLGVVPETAWPITVMWEPTP